MAGSRRPPSIGTRVKAWLGICSEPTRFLTPREVRPGTTRTITPAPNSPEVKSNPLLLRDGLFAAAAIPRVLRKLGLTRNVIVHVQDWQLAATALTVKEAIVDDVLDSAAVVLTSHNPYDCGLTLADLAKITPRVNGDQWPRPEPDTADMQLADPAVADTWSPPTDRGAPVVGDPTRTVDEQS